MSYYYEYKRSTFLVLLITLKEGIDILNNSLLEIMIYIKMRKITYLRLPVN